MEEKDLTALTVPKEECKGPSNSITATKKQHGLIGRKRPQHVRDAISKAQKGKPKKYPSCLKGKKRSSPSCLQRWIGLWSSNLQPRKTGCLDTRG